MTALEPQSVTWREVLDQAQAEFGVKLADACGIKMLANKNGKDYVMLLRYQ